MLLLHRGMRLPAGARQARSQGAGLSGGWSCRFDQCTSVAEGLAGRVNRAAGLYSWVWMRLLLVGNYAPDRQNSMLRYQHLLQRELSARGHEVVIVSPRPVFGRLVQGGALAKWLGYVDKYLLFPLRLRAAAHGWDWVHVCDHSNSVYLPYLPAERSSITCHDVLAIEAAEGKHSVEDVGRRVSSTGRIQQRWIRKHLLRARRVVSISHATARSLAALGVAGEIRVIHNPLNRAFEAASLAEVDRCRRHLDLQAGERYVLHIGGNLWYKNRVGVLRIFGALRMLPPFADLRLVLAGHAWTDEMRAAARDAGLNDDRSVGPVVTWIDPSDDDVEALYTGAELFLFPSLQEGFGWPILEAQSCGTVVATSDRDPMREIAGDAAILIEPNDAHGAAETIAAEWHRLPELREASLRNAAGYTPAELIPAYEVFFRSGLAAAKEGVVIEHAA